MNSRFARSLSDWLSGPHFTLMVPIVVALALMGTACGESTGDCVQVYEFEGTVRKSGYTRSECEEECAIIGRTLSCTFEGRSQSPLEVNPRFDLATD